MASAPKKPRTDEQSRAEEKPEVDGDPQADVPPVRKLRLPPKGRAWLQFFAAKECSRMSQAHEPVRPLVRTLLINRSYLNVFFDAEMFGPAEIWSMCKHSARLVKFFPETCAFTWTFEGTTALLQCASGLTTLKVLCTADSTRLDVHWLLKWQQLASKLHALPALSSIQLETRRLKYPFMNAFVDSLPDCVTRLEADDFRVATCFRKRTALLEEACLSDASGEDAYLADVFRLKNRRIELSLDVSGVMPPYGLSACGPFDRNDHLQELHLFGKVFAEDAVSQTLGHLRAVNAHFKLIQHRCLAPFVYELRDWADINEYVEELVADLHVAGFDGNGSELRIGVKDRNNWQHVDRDQLIDHFQWTREGQAEWPA